jgi:hypothetical protein
MDEVFFGLKRKERRIAIFLRFDRKEVGCRIKKECKYAKRFTLFLFGF